MARRNTTRTQDAETYEREPSAHSRVRFQTISLCAAPSADRGRKRGQDAVSHNATHWSVIVPFAEDADASICHMP